MSTTRSTEGHFLLACFRSTHQEAFELEVSLLEALLRRNRCSHRRTKYFQRLSMALRSLRKHGVLETFEKLSKLKQDLEEKCIYYRKKRKREEVFWDVSAKKEGNQDDEVRQLVTQTENVGNVVVKVLPECLSRFEYAAKALFLEISRGFFLPFCTVAVGTASRIRTLLLRLGRFALQEYLPELEKDWNNLLSTLDGSESSGFSTNELWGRGTDSFVKAYKTLTAMSEPVDFSSRSKADRTRSILCTLGLPCISETSGGSGTAVAKDDVTADGKPSLQTTSEASVEAALDDIGESVADDRVHEKAAQDQPSDKFASLGFLKLSADDVDRNSVIVQDLKAQKKRKKGPDSDSDKATKKKKTKKKKKGDFFDNLFAKQPSS